LLHRAFFDPFACNHCGGSKLGLGTYRGPFFFRKHTRAGRTLHSTIDIAAGKHGRLLNRSDTQRNYANTNRVERNGRHRKSTNADGTLLRFLSSHLGCLQSGIDGDVHCRASKTRGTPSRNTQVELNRADSLGTWAFGPQNQTTVVGGGRRRGRRGRRTVDDAYPRRINKTRRQSKRCFTKAK